MDEIASRNRGAAEACEEGRRLRRIEVQIELDWDVGESGKNESKLRKNDEPIPVDEGVVLAWNVWSVVMRLLNQDGVVGAADGRPDLRGAPAGGARAPLEQRRAKL